MVTQVDIGRTQSGNGARAWLSPSAAASLRRVDRQLGRTVPVTWAGRSEAEQFALIKKYYVRASSGEFYYDGSWWRKKRGSSVVVAHPNETPHGTGNAVDTNDYTRTGFVARMAENGWKRTISSEPWHFVHSNSRDGHLNDPAPPGGATTGTTTEDDMFSEDDRKLLAETLTQVRNVHAGVWTGGVSAGKTYNYGVLPIVAHNQTLIGQQSVQINALTAAVSALAVSKGVDPAAILKTVENGVKEAMRGVTFTTDVDG